MSITENENQDILGRSDLNDIEGILSITNDDVDAIQHIVKDNADAIFTWDYSLTRPALRKLYEKAKVGQWNGSTDLDWSINVDEEKQVAMDLAAFASGLTPAHYGGTTLSKWATKNGPSSLSNSVAGACRSSCTASRVLLSVPRKSLRLFRGTTPSCTPAPR